LATYCLPVSAAGAAAPLPNRLEKLDRLGATAGSDPASLANMVMGPDAVVMTASKSWSDDSLASTLLIETTCIPSLSLDLPNSPSGLTRPITVEPSAGFLLRLIPSFCSDDSLTTVAVTLRGEFKRAEGGGC
jgi:hypothetical protein